MTEFKEFDSFEELVDWQQQQTAKANAILTDEQKSLTWGSDWVRFWDAGAGDLLVIFGHCHTLAEFEPIEKAAGCTAKEWDEYTVPRLIDALDNGYMYGMAYSIIEPTGEPGDTHRAHCWPISRELFDAAQQAEWDINNLSLEHKIELNVAYGNYRAFALATEGQW
jgi:hypothetical protein